MDVGAVSGNAHKSDLAGARASIRASDGRDEVDACAITATGRSVQLSLSHQRRKGHGEEVLFGAACPHGSVYGVVLVRVELELVAQTGRLSAPPPQLRMVLLYPPHVTVPEHYHLLLSGCAMDFGITRYHGALVIFAQQDVVVVMVEREGALEQRLQAIPAQVDARPTRSVPAIPPLQPCGPLVYLVLQSVQRLLALHLAIGAQVADLGAIYEQVVVRLQAETDTLARGGEVEGEVERGQRGDLVVGGEDVGILCEPDAPQRVSGRRRAGRHGGEEGGTRGERPRYPHRLLLWKGHSPSAHQRRVSACQIGGISRYNVQ